ncbi:cation:proton antiporter [Ilumatobacter coccineus]|uniref:Putative CPA1 family transporter n=1 Tax=Ilumatobacter coccineus (strain NBRC 103263 / KCTC 29153 / YM16-304) TaxID=1313172 RepID=A0A6C7E6Q6_ILUCY|nr:cation:proton antiporter [Ilumatobacter coccineus]BAN02171.1 putative CPA1 family transporter [Ilumatobacter coccineus YM16-304]
MGPVEITLVAALVVAFAAVSMRIEHWPLTMPMVFVAAGAATAAFDAIEIDAEIGSIALLAELTLAVILFSDAVRIDFRRLRRHLGLPVRLLGIGLPLSIALGALVNALLFPELPFAQVALLAAILAPTDAALGSAVVEDTVVPARDRLALNVESGVNDGLVVPVVAIMTALVIDENRSTSGWIGFVARQIGWGVALGLVVGGVGITVLRAAHHRGWSDGRYEQLATFVLPVIALFGAEALTGNSFIAAFVAGLAFGSFGNDAKHTPGSASEPDDDAHASYFGGFTEDAAQLLALGAFFVFGNVLLGQAVDDVSAGVVVCAIVTLTLGRMLPVWIAMIGSGTRWPTRLFIGWFGPRGLASIIFGLLLLEDFDEVAGGGDDLFGVIGVTVTASVVLHGATASWGASRYGRWAEALEASDDERSDMNVPEVAEMIPRSRFSLRR